jgi:ketosteroid isomerase-like protein
MKTDSSERTAAFMDALKTLETEQDSATLVALFTGDATLERMTHKTYEGKADAEAFWQEYLAPFATIATEFYNVTEDDDGAVLEWVSEGSLKGGKAIRYRGVSSLSFEGERVKSFRTYYDSAAFLSEGASR